jgi:hypothetical protein
MDQIVLFAHIIRFALQMYFMNLMRNVSMCLNTTSVLDHVVFNGHLISMVLPTILQLQPNIVYMTSLFDIALVVASAIYMQTSCIT